MSEVLRYLIQKTPIGTMMKPNPDGNWISGEDFDRVTAERDAALADLKAMGERYQRDLILSRERWCYGNRADAKIAELQHRLTAADERAVVLETVSVKQAALLEELGIPLDEVDDLFGETLKNAKRYEYLRSVMAVENFPGPHPEWSEPSEAESKRIDDLCDAALKPAEPAKCNACGGRGSVCVDWDSGAWSDCQECTKP